MTYKACPKGVAPCHWEAKHPNPYKWQGPSPTSKEVAAMAKGGPEARAARAAVKERERQWREQQKTEG
jgi:hypothetical protein